MRLVSALFLASIYLASAAEIPAFPGAEGFGAKTQGGRGGRVIYVGNLNDSGAGSLRAAILAKGPRMILFRISGVIDLKSPLVITEPFVTIAGQTAPGDGICLRGDNFAIKTHDVVVRYIRSRMGDERKQEQDSISIQSGARNVVIDHVSASWSIDETLSPSGDVADVTVQWSIISESLRESAHSKGPHGYGMLLRATGGVSIHHNLYADHDARNPRFGDNYFKPPAPQFDFRNNVIYNYGSICSGMVDGAMKLNYVGNYIKPGPASKAATVFSLTPEATATTEIFLKGNIVDGQPEPKYFNRENVATLVKDEFPMPAVETTGATDALRVVLDNAGATLPRRDLVDVRIVEQVKSGKGRLINSQNDVGGWPVYETGEVPKDSDGDGIPDEWESAHGLDPKNAADGARLRTDGYTNLEAYLNSIKHD